MKSIRPRDQMESSTIRQSANETRLAIRGTNRLSENVFSIGPVYQERDPAWHEFAVQEALRNRKAPVKTPGISSLIQLTGIAHISRNGHTPRLLSRAALILKKTTMPIYHQAYQSSEPAQREAPPSFRPPNLPKDVNPDSSRKSNDVTGQ